MDGLVVLEGDEVFGEPVRMDVLVGGRDTVAVDAVASFIMGVDPLRVRHIKLAHEQGMGVGDLNKIDVVGEDPLRVRRKFKLPETVKDIGGVSPRA